MKGDKIKWHVCMCIGLMEPYPPYDVQYDPNVFGCEIHSKKTPRKSRNDLKDKIRGIYQNES